MKSWDERLDLLLAEGCNSQDKIISITATYLAGCMNNAETLIKSIESCKAEPGGKE